MNLDKEVTDKFEKFLARKAKSKSFTGLPAEFYYGGLLEGQSQNYIVQHHLMEIFKALPNDGSIKFNVFHALNDSYKRLSGKSLDLSQHIAKSLERYSPVRIILREGESGWEGLTEDSFSMSWKTDRVNIWWSGKAYSILGEHKLDAVKNAEHNQSKLGGLIFDPLDSMCPVVVDWEFWLSAMSVATNKYDARNAKFFVRVFEKEEEDAKLA